MRKLLALFPIMLATLALTLAPLDNAEAKRFGFGKSLGKQSSFKRSQQAQKPAAPTAQQGTSKAAGGTAPKTSGASRWLGPLAGLAAGGLLAAMLFGDAFEGLQIMDFLLIAGLVFGGLMLFKAMRRQAPQPSPAGGPNFGDGFQPRNEFDSEDADFSDTPQATVNTNNAPSWFDPESFTRNAKTHFIRLQAAWDKGDLKDIAEYTTPELFAEIQSERLSRGTERHFTDVTQLDAELLQIDRDGDQVVASVRFSGMIREEEQATPEPFTEVWNVVHAWDAPGGDWFIAGIQQV